MSVYLDTPWTCPHCGSHDLSPNGDPARGKQLSCMSCGEATGIPIGREDYDAWLAARKAAAQNRNI